MSKKQDIGHGGIDDCPRCHLHFVSVAKVKVPDDDPIQWRVCCSNCYLEGPCAGSPRFAIKAWNEKEEEE